MDRLVLSVMKVEVPRVLHVAAKVASAKRGKTLNEIIADAMRRDPTIKAEMNGKERK